MELSLRSIYDIKDFVYKCEQERVCVCDCRRIYCLIFVFSCKLFLPLFSFQESKRAYVVPAEVQPLHHEYWKNGEVKNAPEMRVGGQIGREVIIRKGAKQTKRHARECTHAVVQV